MSKETLPPPVFGSLENQKLRNEIKKLETRLSVLLRENADLANRVSALYRERHGIKTMFSEGALTIEVSSRVMNAMEGQSELFQSLLDFFGIDWEMIPESFISAFRGCLKKHTEEAMAMFFKDDVDFDEEGDGPATMEGLAPQMKSPALQKELSPELSNLPISRRGGTRQSGSSGPFLPGTTKQPRSSRIPTLDISREMSPKEQAQLDEISQAYRRTLK
ncbi:MAG: hypothetical protein NUV81_00200 [bacterium]|nr:hypothetical protein [bacterium]